MKINEIFFDICDFSHTDHVREITVFCHEELIKITEQKVDDTDLWIVQPSGVRAILKENHHEVYAMFFGILLTALHKHNTRMPVHEVCMGDVEYAFEDPSNRLRKLADAIASGTYLPKK